MPLHQYGMPNIYSASKSPRSTVQPWMMQICESDIDAEIMCSLIRMTMEIIAMISICVFCKLCEPRLSRWIKLWD